MREQILLRLPKTAWELRDGLTRNKIMRLCDYIEETNATGQRRAIKDRFGPTPRIISEGYGEGEGWDGIDQQIDPVKLTGAGSIPYKGAIPVALEGGGFVMVPPKTSKK